MLLVIEVRPAHYKWRLGNIGRSINDRCWPVSAGPSKMGYFQDSWSHVQWKNLLKGLLQSSHLKSGASSMAWSQGHDSGSLSKSFCVNTSSNEWYAFGTTSFQSLAFPYNGSYFMI